MKQVKGIPNLVLILDIFILGYSAFEIFTGSIGEGANNWFIYLLSYVIGDATIGIQEVNGRPRNVVELTFMTQKPYMGLTISSFILKLFDFALVILLISSLFTKSMWSWLGGISLLRIILFLFTMVGINYQFNQAKRS